MNKPSPLLSVGDALARVLAGVTRPLAAETAALADARGRTLAEDRAARRTQPPVAVSAMDGYAVRVADLAHVPATFSVVGVSAAGHAFGGAVGPGEAVRIFTGAAVPAGADTVLIQENTRREGEESS